MRIFIPTILPRKPLLDILGGHTQIFQGDAINLKKFVVSKLANADFILVPHDAAFWSSEYETELSELASKKPLIFFNRSDFPVRVRIPNSYSFQNHLCNHDQANQVIIPYNINKVKNPSIRKYSPLPVISFVGYVPKFLSRGTLLHMKHDFPFGLWNNASVVRKVGLRRISSSKLPKIIVTRTHYGGAKSLVKSPNTFRLEYEDSMKYSDLVFCPRGTGNSSQRLYEALSAGKIPILPDTKMALPKFPGNELGDFLIFTSPFSFNIEQDVFKYWSKLDSKSYLNIQKYLKLHLWPLISYNSYIPYLFKKLSKEKHLAFFVA